MAMNHLIAFKKHHPHGMIQKIIDYIPSGFRTEPVLEAIRENLSPGLYHGLEFCHSKVNHASVLLGFKINRRGQVEILQVWRHGANIWDILNLAQIEEQERACKSFYDNQRAYDASCDATSAAEWAYEVSL